MVRLVTLQAARFRMGAAPSDHASDPAILSGLDAAHLRVRSELDTNLDQAAYTDSFNLIESIQGAMVDGEWRLRLSNGFLRASPAPVVVRTRSLWAASGDDETLTANVDYKIDAEKGYVALSPTITGLVTVSYTAGFVAEDVPGDIPDWLSDAILAYAPVVMDFSNVFSRAELTALNNLNIGHAMAVLAPHRRTTGMSLYPMAR